MRTVQGLRKALRIAAMLVLLLGVGVAAVGGSKAGPGVAAQAAVANAFDDPLYSSGFDTALPAGSVNIPVSLPGVALIGRLYVPVAPLHKAALLVHGCSGMWSGGVPWSVAQSHIEKWGKKLSDEGYLTLAIDSYTSRTPPGDDAHAHAFQVQCSGTPYAGYVDPYTTRVDDIAAGIAFLRYRYGLAGPHRIALVGWSQGGEAVMVADAETERYRDVSVWDSPNSGFASLGAAVVFYPGCDTDLGYRNGSGIGDSYWRPHRDLRMNHGGADLLSASCVQRAGDALSNYGAIEGSGHWMDMHLYADAHHSFDLAVPAWPAVRCADTLDTSDPCAAADADVASFDFLSTRVY